MTESPWQHMNVGCAWLTTVNTKRPVGDGSSFNIH